MNALHRAAELLREEASNLDAQAELISPKINPGDITSVAEFLTRECPGWTLQMELDHSQYSKKTKLSWNIWDGTTHHAGKTLADALESFRIARAKPSETAVLDAEVALTGQAVPF